MEFKERVKSSLEKFVEREFDDFEDFLDLYKFSVKNIDELTEKLNNVRELFEHLEEYDLNYSLESDQLRKELEME